MNNHFIHPNILRFLSRFFSFGFLLLIPTIGFSSESSVLFKAYVQDAVAVQSAENIPFISSTEDYNIGNGWKNDSNKFIAPITGYYHFDVAVGLKTNSVNADCRFMVNLHNYRAHYRTYPLFELRIDSTDVANSPNEHINRPSSQLLSGNGGLDLYMRNGDEVYIRFTGGHSSCYDLVTFNGKKPNDLTYGTYITGHLIIEQENAGMTDSESRLVSENNIKETNSSSYDVQIVSEGKNKIATIKLVRKITQVSLKEAKQIFLSLPSIVVSKTTLDAANNIAIKFQEIGVLTKILVNN